MDIHRRYAATKCPSTRSHIQCGSSNCGPSCWPPYKDRQAPNWQIGGSHSLRRAIQRRYAPAIRFSRLVHDENDESPRPVKGELDGEINCKRGCERARGRQEQRAARLLDITQYLDRFSACDSCGNVPTHRN